MLRLSFALSLVACAAAAELPEPPEVPAGKSDGVEDILACSYANPSIAAIDPKFAGLAPVLGLRALDGVPLPAIGHDANGFFHPRRRVIHSGTLDVESEALGDYIDALGFDSTGFRSGVPVGIPTPYLEGGTFATQSPVADELRLGVWNIARGSKLDTVIEQIRRMDADVWLINEGDFYGNSSGGRVAAREIAKALGYAYVASGEFYELRDDRRGLSGNAILSRFPLSDVQTVYLPLFGGRDWAKAHPIDRQPRCGQRSALSARVSITQADGSSKVVNLISAHLENMASAGARENQLRVVRELLAVPGEPTLVGGDFNTLEIGEGTRIRDGLAQGKDFPYSFADCSHGDDTNTFLLKRIDWILAQGVTCSGYRVATEATGSDHEPVLTEVAL